MKFVLQSSDASENCNFTRWVDPAPIDSVQEFIEYLQIKMCVMCVSLSLYYEVKFDGSHYVMHFLVLISYRYIN